MAVILWWKERLAARRPIGTDTLWVKDVTFKAQLVNPEDNWPRAVAKQFLLADYQQWFKDVYLPPYLETGYYQDCPAQLPQAATDLDFFVTMSPFLHIVGRDQQTRAYKVKEQRLHEGSWITIKAAKNFVRLLEWEAHVAAFELATGIDGVQPATEGGKNDARMQVVTGGVKVVLRRMAASRETLEKAIGRP